MKVSRVVISISSKSDALVVAVHAVVYKDDRCKNFLEFSLRLLSYPLVSGERPREEGNASRLCNNVELDNTREETHSSHNVRRKRKEEGRP